MMGLVRRQVRTVRQLDAERIQGAQGSAGRGPGRLRRRTARTESHDFAGWRSRRHSFQIEGRAQAKAGGMKELFGRPLESSR